MDIFESLENLSISEDCFNSILDIVESIIMENKLEDQESSAVKALKELRATHNSGRRHYEAQAKKLPGKIKKAEKEFEEARGKVYDTERKIRFDHKTPEREKAHEIYKLVATGNYKDDNEKQLLINKHREYQDKHENQVKQELEKTLPPLEANREKKRKVMADLRGNKGNKISDNLAKYRNKVGQLNSAIKSIKSN